MNRLLLPFIMLTFITTTVAQQNRKPTTIPLDLEGYFAQLNHWSAAARRLGKHPEEAAVVRKKLPDSLSVIINGQHFILPTDWLRGMLTSLESNCQLSALYSRDIQAHLAAMRSEAEGLTEPSGLDAAAAYKKLDEILRRRDFRAVHRPPWLDRLWERLSLWLGELLRTLFSRLARPPIRTEILFWAMVIAPALLVLAWVVRLMLSRHKNPGIEVAEPALVSGTWRTFAQDALLAAGRADYRDAIRYSYWAGVYRLEELGVWQAERTRTPREYLRLLPETYRHRDSVSAITSRFERTWYGGQAASSDDYQITLGQLEKLGCTFPSMPATARF